MEKIEEQNIQKVKSPALVWVSAVLAVLAWLVLMFADGYVALGLGVLSAVCGFAGMPGRSTAIKRLAVTAVIASVVLVVVLSAFLIVYRVVLSA
ncbi:MAG: hypothetical protein K2F63_01605 [Muribaculaceae bacterium]|nr:hypothetical protein [Muribaculaceae bacterium]